jgi:hypothetical protein
MHVLAAFRFEEHGADEIKAKPQTKWAIQA